MPIVQGPKGNAGSVSSTSALQDTILGGLEFRVRPQALAGFGLP